MHFFNYLEEETQNFTTQMFSSGFFVIHDTAGGGQDNIAELTRGQQVVGPLFNVIDGHIETGRDDAALVQATGEVDNNLAGTVIIDNFEFTNVAMFHHNSQELDDDLGAGAEEDLTLSTLFSVVNAFQGIGQYVHTHHGWKRRKHRLVNGTHTQQT